MPRANRHHLLGCIWLLTHRCHRREFLLKSGRDLGMVAQHREVEAGKHGFALREANASYAARSEAEMAVGRAQNTLPWRIAS